MDMSLRPATIACTLKDAEWSAEMAHRPLRARRVGTAGTPPRLSQNRTCGRSAVHNVALKKGQKNRLADKALLIGLIGLIGIR